jgi:hypothetical protein
MSLWEKIKAFFRQVFSFVKNVIKHFLIGAFFEVSGFPLLLTSFMTVITERGRRFFKKIYYNKRTREVLDERGNPIWIYR